MAVRLSPPKKNVFWFAVALGLLAVILYLIGVLGFVDGGFAFVGHFAFWLAMAGLFLIVVAVTWWGV